MSSIYVRSLGTYMTFKEELRSQDFSFSGNSFSLRRTFQCKWSLRFHLARAFLGESAIHGKNNIDPWIFRDIPYGFKHLTDTRPGRQKPVLYPVGVEKIEGMGPTRSTSTERYNDPDLYTRARVTFLYDSPTFNVASNSDIPLVNFRSKTPTSSVVYNPPLTTYQNRFEARRFTTRITQPTTEALRLPVGYFNYVEGFRDGVTEKAKPQQPVDVGNYVLCPSLDVTYVFHQVPALVQSWESGVEWAYQDRDELAGNPLLNQVGVKPDMLGAVYTHVGCVNSRWFDDFPPGTLLLTSVEARPYKWITGERYYDYTYRMKFMNPQDIQASNKGPFVYSPDGGMVDTRSLDVPYSYVGHNYFLRYKAPMKEGDTTVVIEPYFSLITHNGKTLESGGRPIFQYRDFEDLFIPYNRAHLVRYYKNTVLTPLWNEAGT